jgi:hypothetical protein
MNCRVAILFSLLISCESGTGRAAPAGDRAKCIEPPLERREPTDFPDERANRSVPCFDTYGNSHSKEDDFIYALFRLERNKGIDAKEKTRRLVEYADSHPLRRPAVLAYLADIDWNVFLEYVATRAAALEDEDWREACRRLWRAPLRRVGETRRPSRVMKLVYERATRDKNEDVRRSAMIALGTYGVSGEEAVGLAARLPLEADPGIRQTIYAIQLWHNDPRTNKVINDLIRSDQEPEDLKELLGVHLYDDGFVERNRYDFLPELRLLEGRLKRVQDVRNRYKAEKLRAAVAQAIVKLEEKKKEKALIGGTKPPEDP